MPELVSRLAGRLPLQFRVLHRQFLLRVIDLESLSIQADIPRFLGQFAGILIMFSVIQSVGFLMALAAAPRNPIILIWSTEQRLISTMMLVAGLTAVASWDNIFPDRRDAMILGPLPVRPRTILVAKAAACAAIVGLGILALNSFTGLLVPSALGGVAHLPRALAAYWLTMIAASVFSYGSLLTIQGFMALLPRRLFLRLSAFLQIAAFGILMSVYFLEPTLPTTAALKAANVQWVLASNPSYWFFALFNQLSGTLPPSFTWLAARAWMGLAAAALGATASLLLCYLRTMRKTVEEPDLVPAARGFHWHLLFGSRLQTAILLFGLRSLTRSRQHRLAFAFYLSVVLAIALSWLHANLSAAAPRPLGPDVLIASFMMMTLAVFGLRNVFALPISRTCNWVWRTTQLSPSEKYIAATRDSLFFLAALPVWIVSAALFLAFKPWSLVAAHLAILALFGWIFVELSLIGFYKIPFTCSYLPGKVNLQLLFWSFVLVLSIFALSTAQYELRSLNHPVQYLLIAGALSGVALGLWRYNSRHAKSAVLYFEELPPEIITTLGLTRDGVSIARL